MPRLLVAAIQMNSTPNKAANLQEAAHFLQKAKKQRARLVSFPENFSILTDNSEEFLEAAEIPGGPTSALMQEWARKNKIWVHGGSIPLLVPGRKRQVTNSSLLISPQ